MAEKSVCVTYILWLAFGWFGVHHFYLRRDRHAFVWWSSLGGFLLGWIRDLWRIPTYVNDVNNSAEFVEAFARETKLRKYPGFSISRFIGSTLLSTFYATLVKLAAPDDTSAHATAPFVILGIALGAHAIGNIGRQRIEFLRPAAVVAVVYVGLAVLNGEQPNGFVVSLIAYGIFGYWKRWRGTKKQPAHFCKRAAKLALCATVVMSLWSSYVYFNMEITTEGGEKVKVRDAVSHFFKSPAWLELKEVTWQLYAEARRMGWRNVWNAFVNALDPKGEKNAIKVLNVSDKATDAEIRRAYKKLAVQWHPDRHTDPTSKKDAQEKFIEIQQAYEILSSRKKSGRSAEGGSGGGKTPHTEF